VARAREITSDGILVGIRLAVENRRQHVLTRIIERNRDISPIESGIGYVQSFSTQFGVKIASRKTNGQGRT